MKTCTIIVVLAAAVTSSIGGVLSFPPSLHRKRIELQCLNNFILLKIHLQDIPNIKPSSLHLRHLSCKPYYVTNSSAFFKVPFQGCGTTRGTKDNYISFTNAVGNSARSRNESHVMVSRGLELHVPFTCYYRAKYTITVQEREGTGTGNHSGKKQRSGGHTNRSSSVPVQFSSGGKVMSHPGSIVTTVFLLLTVVFS